MLVLFDGKSEKKAEISCAEGETISERIWLSGKVRPVALCNSLGLCGRCRGRYITNAPEPTSADLSFFDKDQLRQGWRLLCRQTAPAHDAHLELPDYVWQNSKTAFQPTASKRKANLGVDLGTTSLQWRAVAWDDANDIVFEQQLPNPQAGAGSDIVSRIAYAKEAQGLQKLSDLAWQAITAVIVDLQAANCAVERIAIAANSVLTTILLKKDISGFINAPWKLSWWGGEIIRHNFPETGQKEIIIPPLIAPFIGGDISAGVLALIRSGADAPFLLADMGTNCEFALMKEKGELLFASTPLGPALEGIGPAKGMAAEPGAVTDFYLSPQGLAPVLHPGSEVVTGISGSGYIALLSLLRKMEIMTAEGQFRQSAKIPLALKILAGLTNTNKMAALELGNGLYLTANDVEQLLKIKAAFSVALKKIISKSGIDLQSLQHVYLAGALGKHIKIENLVVLGFLPPDLAKKTVVSGNTALKGACLLAANPNELQYLQNLCRDAELIDLVNDVNFQKDYIDAMRWD